MTVKDLRKLLYDVENQDAEVVMSTERDINDIELCAYVDSATINVRREGTLVLMPSGAMRDIING